MGGWRTGFTVADILFMVALVAVFASLFSGEHNIVLMAIFLAALVFPIVGSPIYITYSVFCRFKHRRSPPKTVTLAVLNILVTMFLWFTMIGNRENDRWFAEVTYPLLFVNLFIVYLLIFCVWYRHLPRSSPPQLPRRGEA